MPSLVETLVARTAQDQTGLNTVVVLTYPVRFQFAPGAANGLGIVGADFVATSGGAEIASGTTDANGEVQIPIMALFSAPVTVTILGTDYVFSFKPQQQAEVLAGLQQRLDKLGYLSGYQLAALDGTATDDGKDGPETQQSFMNFQTDENLAPDGVIGPISRQVLVAKTGV
jgi:peptidoglycan hydrolase-like protein with peptidoglycan-binding domain